MNEFITHFHFLRPLWFLSILPAVVLVYFLMRHQSRSSQWTSLINEKLLPYLLDGEFSKTQKAPLFGLIVLWLVAAISLAGPTWEKKPEPVQKDVSAMVILWDMSPSMFAQDIKPSRLVRSRLKLFDLLDQREEGLTALVAYAGDAHVVTPLTDDTATIKSLLPGLTPSMMPMMGSNPEEAFVRAHELLKETGVAKGDIVFVTDGIANGAIVDLASTSQTANHRVTVWGIGTPEGAPIPLPSGGFLKNNSGEIVVARVDESTLSEAATRMQGVYVPFSNDKLDIETISHFGIEQDQLQRQENSKVFDQWLERGHWLVLFIIPFAALSFRRGWILCFCLGVFLSPDSYALSFTDLWKTKDQQAEQLLEADENQAAADTFKNSDWKAVANYRAGNYEEAQEQFQAGDSASEKYNYANTLTHLGEYDKAIEEYQAALEMKPDFAAAKNNKKIAEQLKALQEQQQENQQGESGENQDQSQQQDGDQQEGQQQDGQQSSESKSENQQSSTDQGQEEQSDGSEQSDGNQQLDQTQKEALDQKYNNQDKKGEDASEEEQITQQEAEAKQEQEEKAVSQQNSEDKTGDDQQSASAMMQMSEEEKEQQQALEQWLRRVPDDPSGLLRNKFRHEYEKRRREIQTRNLRAPNSIPEERW